MTTDELKTMYRTDGSYLVSAILQNNPQDVFVRLQKLGYTRALSVDQMYAYIMGNINRGNKAVIAALQVAFVPGVLPAGHDDVVRELLYNTNAYSQRNAATDYLLGNSTDNSGPNVGTRPEVSLIDSGSGNGTGSGSGLNWNGIIGGVLGLAGDIFGRPANPAITPPKDNSATILAVAGVFALIVVLVILMMLFKK